MFGMNNSMESTINKDWKSEGKNIVKLKELAGQERRVWGFMTTKDAGFGNGILLCADDCKIALPKRYYDNFVNGSKEDKEALMSGRCYVTDIKEITTKNGTKTTVFDLITK